MALRPAKLGVSLFRHPCRKPLSPGKGVNTGTGVPATCLGATPQTPFLDNDRGFSTDWPLPRGEGLCMLSWLCICAIVVVCCRCVLHRLCSTTCMRPCIEHLGIHARHPCRGYITGATAPSPCLGLRPCDPFFIAKSFFDRLIIYLLYNGIVWGIA